MELKQGAAPGNAQFSRASGVGLYAARLQHVLLFDSGHALTYNMKNK